MHFFITGMFDSSNGVEHAVNAGNSQSGDRHDRKPPRTDRKDFTSGVVGVSINRQGSSDEPGMDETDNLYLEDVSLHLPKAFFLIVCHLGNVLWLLINKCSLWYKW